jgi:hypothetical protein
MEAPVFSNIFSSNANIAAHFHFSTSPNAILASKPFHSVTQLCFAQIMAATAFWWRSDTRHALPLYRRNWRRLLGDGD